MQNYARGIQDGSQSQLSDYQQYIKRYAGQSQGRSQFQSSDYQKYIKRYDERSQGGSQIQSSDYERYIKRYEERSQGSFQSHSGEHQQSAMKSDKSERSETHSERHTEDAVKVAWFSDEPKPQPGTHNLVVYVAFAYLIILLTMRHRKLHLAPESLSTSVA